MFKGLLKEALRPEDGAALNRVATNQRINEESAVTLSMVEF